MNRFIKLIVGVSMSKIAVVGATGAVGRCFVELLLDRVPASELMLCASAKSAGSLLTIKQHEFIIHDLALVDFTDVKLAFFSAGASVAKAHAERAVAAGAFVVDNSSGFRETMPLVVPEINLPSLSKPQIIANPNCVVIPLCLILHALREFQLKHVSVVSFQSVSGSGNKGLSALAAGGPSAVYQAPIAGNVIPKIDDFLDNGFTKEEMKIKTETNKILQDDCLVTATAVRVPVTRGHSIAVHVTAKQAWDLERVISLLSNKPSISLVPDTELLTPKTHVQQCPGVMVSRVRLEVDNPNGLLFWLVSDNLLKGAALNSIQIAERLGLLAEFAYE